MIVPVMAISNLALTRQIYSEETNGAHAHYREPVPLSGRSLNMVFSTFILRYVESKFTLLTYLMENNTVITVISYCTKGLNNSKTKQKPIPTIHNKSIKSRVFNLTEGS